MNTSQLITRPLLIASTLVMLIAAPAQLFAQSDSPESPVKAWVNLGYGFASSDNMSGISKMTKAQYNAGFGLIGLRYSRVHDNVSRCGLAPSFIDDTSEIGLTYGYDVTRGMFSFSSSVGVGSMWGKERSSSNTEEFNTISFPVQANITFRPVSVVGLGVMISKSFNSKSPVTGAMLVLQLGRFR